MKKDLAVEQKYVEADCPVLSVGVLDYAMIRWMPRLQGYLHFLKDFQGQREANIGESSVGQPAMSWEELISEQEHYMLGK
jgi:hypothetical protein